MFLIYSCLNKHRNHAIYSLFDHFLFFNILASGHTALDSLIYLGLVTPESDKICTFDMFMSEFVVASQSMLLFMAGLILLAERARITEQQQREDEEAGEEAEEVGEDGGGGKTRTNSTTTNNNNNNNKSIFAYCGFLYADSDPVTLAGANHTTMLNCLTKNARSLILVVGYMSAFAISAVLRHWYPNSAACESTLADMTPLVQLASLLLALLVLFLYYSSLVYYFLTAATSRARTVRILRDRLSPKDFERIRLAKKLTIINCLHGVFLLSVALCGKIMFVIPSPPQPLPRWLTLFVYYIDTIAVFVTILVFYAHEYVVNNKHRQTLSYS